MEESELARAGTAARTVATSLGLPAYSSVVVFSSNKLALRLLPCDVLARVTRAGLAGEAALELQRARRLAAAGCPVGSELPGVAPGVHQHDGFAVTLWTYYPPVDRPVAAPDYARALAGCTPGCARST